MSPPIPAALQVRGTPARWGLRATTLVGLAVYLGATFALIGIRAEHLILAGTFAALVFAGGRAFRFVLLSLPVTLTGISYDYFRLLQGVRGDVHVADLYRAELAWFGVGRGAERQVLASWFVHHTHPLLDLVCGLAYLLYLFAPIVCAIALYFVNQERMLVLGVVFFATNLLGMIVYLLYPAAPPWYVAKYGLGPAQLDALPDPAGTLRFDELLGIGYFQSFYSRSANVFGAMPSLHVAYPAATSLALVPLGVRWWAPFAAFTLLVAFAALYFQHHYVLDILAGMLCALIAWLGATIVMRRGATPVGAEN
jgi:membrane-associated phospholipid phosphatase